MSKGKKEYTEKYVVDILKKNQDININEESKTIEVAYGFNKLGNSTWGKVDYLEKVHGWTRVFMPEVKRTPQPTGKKKRRNKERKEEAA